MNTRPNKSAPPRRDRQTNAPLKASVGELSRSARVVRWERPDCKVCHRPIDLRRQPHGWMHLTCEDIELTSGDVAAIDKPTTSEET